MDKPIVNIRRSGNLLEIEPGRLDILRPLLTYTHRDIGKSFDYQSTDKGVQYIEKELFQIKDNKVYTLQGARDRVINALTKAGCQCLYTDMRPKQVLEPDYNWFAQCMPDLNFRFKQDEVLATLIGRDNGQIVAPTAYGKTFIMLALAALYPKANIIIASPAAALLRGTYGRMLKITPDVGRVGGGKNDPQRITLCTYNSIMNANIDKCDILLIDECITGDSIITTELGDVRMDQAEKLGCQYVLTSCEARDTFKRIVKYYNQGTRNTLEIVTNRGKLRCTPEHKIMTALGWVNARDLTPTATIQLSGIRDTPTCQQQHLNAPVDVANVHRSNTENRHRVWQGTGVPQPSTDGLLEVTPGAKVTGWLGSIKNLWVDSWVRYWETPVYRSPTKEPYRLDSCGIMDLNKPNGLSTRFLNWIPAYAYHIRKYLMPAGVKYPVEALLGVIQNLHACATYCIRTVRSVLLKRYWTCLQTKVLPGGSAMMVPVTIPAVCYQRMDSVKQNSTSYNAGLENGTTYGGDCSKIKSTICGSSEVESLTGSDLNKSSSHISRRVCDTNYATVLSVTESQPEQVYDLEVEDCHCFYANGMLVHNCHKASAPQISSNLAKIRNAVKTFGMTATPTGRSDNAHLPIEVLLGPVVATIEYDEAVDEGIVSQLKVGLIEMPVNSCAVNSYDYATKPAKKRNCYWRNNARNVAFAHAITEYPKALKMRDNPQTLVLVETTEHAFRMAKLLPDFSVVYANMQADRLQKLKDLGLVAPDYKAITPTQRDNMLRDFECGKLRKVIATGCWGEGVDFVNLDVVANVSGSPSSISTIQWSGRNSRMYEGKDFGLVIDSLDKWDKWANGRAQQRMTVYRQKKWEIIKGDALMNQPAAVQPTLL